MSYVINICGKNFTIGNNLKRHKNTCTGRIDWLNLLPLTMVWQSYTAFVYSHRSWMHSKWKDCIGESTFGKHSNIHQPSFWPYYLVLWPVATHVLDMIRTIAGIELNEGIPSDIDSDAFMDVSERNLIVLDDLMDQWGGDKRIANLFTKGGQHRNLSVIYIVQNIFHQGKETRTTSLNAHYIVLFKSPCDKQQVSILARQVNQGHVHEFKKSYDETTSRPYGHLMLYVKPIYPKLYPWHGAWHRGPKKGDACD